MDIEEQKNVIKIEYKRLWNILHIACHLLWLKLWIFIANIKISFLYSEWSPRNRKIVIIGDDTAIGVGDWVTMGQEPGIQGRLNNMINKDVVSRIIGRGTLWSCFTCGKSGSTTGDWVPPTSDSVTIENVCSEKKSARLSLFEKAFDPCVGAHRDADIVILIIGSKDRGTVIETVENIRRIAVELLRLKKAVILTTIPLPAFVLSKEPEVMVRFRARTLAFNDLLKEIQSKSYDSMHASVNAVGFDDNESVTGQCSCQHINIAPLAENMTNDFLYRFNGMTLNGKGYTRMVDIIYDKLVPLMRAIDGNKECRKNI